MVACPGGGPAGHAFCERLGCDFCVIVVSTPPTMRYECDGLRRAPGEASLIRDGKWNGSIATAVRYPVRVKDDE